MLKIQRLHKTVYGTVTLLQVARSYVVGTPQQIEERVLGATIAYSITSIRDTLGSLEQMTQDPATIRGESTHMNRAYAKTRAPLRLQDMNSRTQSVREAHFKRMQPYFKKLDDETNRLGDAAALLASHLAHLLENSGIIDTGVAEKVVTFSPEAKYNGDTGEIEYRANDGSYAPLTSFEKLNDARREAGQGNKLVQSLLELKVASAALRATIDDKVLQQVSAINDYPSDPHSEVMDAMQTVEANLGYLSSQRLPASLSRLIKKSIPGRLTQLAQAYVEHKTNPWFVRIVGTLGLVTGMASLVVGVPEIVQWASHGVIDEAYTPLVSFKPGLIAALVLTSEGLGAVTFSLLTLGSDVGTKLVRDIRKLEFYSLREV